MAVLGLLLSVFLQLATVGVPAYVAFVVTRRVHRARGSPRTVVWRGLMVLMFLAIFAVLAIALSLILLYLVGAFYGFG